MLYGAAIVLLTHGHQSLISLQVLSLTFVIENVSDLTSVNPGTPATLMDADHSDAHRPGAVADAEGQVLVICLHVLAHQTVLDDYVE